MKPQKTSILTDSKATLQSLISNTSDQPIHLLPKDLQLLSHEYTVVQQWIPPHRGIPGMKEQITWPSLGANNCDPCPPPLTRKPEPCSETVKDEKGEWPLETKTPLQNQSTGQDTVACKHTCSEQTVHHTLQDCSIWRQQRHQIWLQDESTTNKLWGTAEDLRRTTQFLATCGLRV